MGLVPGGPWQRGFLLASQESDGGHGLEITVTDLAREQASWWIANIRAAAEHAPITDPRPMESMLTRKVFTDTAGGSSSSIKNGVGGFCPPFNWFYFPWPPLIRENRGNIYGVRFAHKLSCLEGFGVLLGLVTIPDVARNRGLEIRTDNAGFVGIFKKKHSACTYSYTIAKAEYDVACGLACKVNVVKTPRVSGVGEEVADALSKGDWERA